MNMDDPIPIRGRAQEMEEGEPKVTAEDWLKFREQKHTQRTQWFFLVFTALLLGGFVAPLIIWLIRLALGE